MPLMPLITLALCVYGALLPAAPPAGRHSPAVQTRRAAGRGGYPLTRSTPGRLGAVAMSVNDDDDWEPALRDDLAFFRSETIEFGASASVLEKSFAHEAWVLIFNPSSDDEGVYTLHGQSPNHGSNPNRTYLVSFASQDDAERFGGQLAAEEFASPAPARWSAEAIRAFCHASAFDLAYVPSNALLLPPARNVFDTPAFKGLLRPKHEAEVPTLAPGWETELRDGIALSRHESVQFGAPAPVLRESDTREAWVLLFNPSTPDEGVYTLQGQAPRPRRTYLVSFAIQDDAQRFGAQLEAEGLELAAAALWSAEAIREFCKASEFDLALVPANALLLPPVENVFDKDKEVRQGPMRPEHDGRNAPETPAREVPGAIDLERCLLQPGFRVTPGRANPFTTL